MFETISESLGKFGQFCVIGFAFGFLYDWLRCLRIIFPAKKTRINIEDFFFIIFAAFILFFCIIEYAGGKIRLYFIIAAILGAVIYIYTIGFLTKYIAKGAAFVLNSIKRLIVKIISKPVSWLNRLIKQNFMPKFSALCQKISKKANNIHFSLKKGTKLVYNNSNSKMDNIYGSEGEKQRVIKAEIRKKA